MGAMRGSLSIVLVVAAASCKSDECKPSECASGECVAGECRPQNECEVAGGRIIEHFTGTVVDEAGAPVEGAYAQLCVHLPLLSDVKACLRPALADATGAFDLAVRETEQCMRQPIARMSLPETNYAATYCDVEPDGSNILAAAEVLTLFDTAPPTVLPPVGDPTVERTVVCDDGLEIRWTPSLYFGPGDGYERLGCRRVPVDSPGLCFLDASVLEGVYALTPEGEVGTVPDPSPTFSVRIPNSTALPAGTAVDLYVLAGLGCGLPDGTQLDSGKWQRYGSGAVDSLGQYIEGDGLPCVTWFGYGRAQPE